jgi:hypothetical protein
VNRLLKAGSGVYWLKSDGTIWVPATAVVHRDSREGRGRSWCAVEASATKPGDMIKLKPLRIGLVDQYGGLAPSGWIRWLFEQFSFHSKWCIHRRSTREI